MLSRRLTLFSLMFFLLCALRLSAAGVGPVAKFLPKNNEITGWKTFPGSLQYVKGEGLTDLYNGGYELYTKNGVKDAAAQIYTRGSVTASVTVHTMTNPKSAKSFLAYWKKESASRKPKTVKIGDGAFHYTADGAVNGYMVVKNYYVTVMVQAADKQAVADTQGFMRFITTKVLK